MSKQHSVQVVSVLAREKSERYVRRLQEELLSRLPDGNYFYISGGTKCYSTNGEAICKLLGNELAKLQSTVLVTGDFLGLVIQWQRDFMIKVKNWAFL